jgi:hypothetical protein
MKNKYVFEKNIYEDEKRLKLFRENIILTKKNNKWMRK